MKKRRRPAPSNPKKDTPPDEATKITYEYQEVIDLKNRYLKNLEVKYYDHLRQKYEHQQKLEKLGLLEKKKFEHDVYQRAKQMIEEIRKESKEKKRTEIIFKTRKISDSVKELVEQSKEQSGD